MRDNKGRFIKGHKIPKVWITKISKMWFQKNQKPWNKKEHIEFICIKCGKKFYDKPCNNNRKYCSKVCANSSRIHSEITKEKMSKMRKEYIAKYGFSIEHRKNISRAQLGNKSHCWRGGTSKEPYPFNFDKDLKLIIKFRDNFTCQLCRLRENGQSLVVHHIDYVKENLDWNNLITLCNSCHSKTNSNRKHWIKLFNDPPTKAFSKAQLSSQLQTSRTSLSTYHQARLPPAGIC